MVHESFLIPTPTARYPPFPHSSFLTMTSEIAPVFGGVPDIANIMTIPDMVYLTSIPPDRVNRALTHVLAELYRGMTSAGLDVTNTSVIRDLYASAVGTLHMKYKMHPTGSEVIARRLVQYATSCVDEGVVVSDDGVTIGPLVIRSMLHQVSRSVDRFRIHLNPETGDPIVPPLRLSTFDSDTRVRRLNAEVHDAYNRVDYLERTLKLARVTYASIREMAARAEVVARATAHENAVASVVPMGVTPTTLSVDDRILGDPLLHRAPTGGTSRGNQSDLARYIRAVELTDSLCERDSDGGGSDSEDGEGNPSSSEGHVRS